MRGTDGLRGRAISSVQICRYLGEASQKNKNTWTLISLIIIQKLNPKPGISERV